MGSKELVDQGQLLGIQGWTLALWRIKQAWQNGIMEEQSLCSKRVRRDRSREGPILREWRHCLLIIGMESGKPKLIWNSS